MSKIRICAVKWFEGGRWYTTFYRSEPEARARMREADNQDPPDYLDYVDVELTADGIVDALNRLAD